LALLAFTTVNSVFSAWPPRTAKVRRWSKSGRPDLLGVPTRSVLAPVRHFARHGAPSSGSWRTCVLGACANLRSEGAHLFRSVLFFLFFFSSIPFSYLSHRFITMCNLQQGFAGIMLPCSRSRRHARGELRSGYIMPCYTNAQLRDSDRGFSGSKAEARL
jgi:hypothetical protein